MNEMDAQPKVSPPTSYKAPSFPTLAALGVISAAALVSGCERSVMGEMPMRPYTETQNAVEEKVAPTEAEEMWLVGILTMPEPEPTETQNAVEEKATPLRPPVPGIIYTPKTDETKSE